MWEIHSKTWGKLQATMVYNSATIDGTITAHKVTRDGKEMWTKVYIPLHDITLVVHEEI